MASKTDMSVATILSVLLVMNFAGLGAADMEKDRKECGSQLEALLPCLAYAQGQQKSPPLDCCTGLKQVLQKSKVCLCVLIKDRNSLGPGLELNATLALGLPTRCNAPSEVDQCPSLLQLKPGSPDAKIFEDFAKNNNGSISTPTGKENGTSDGSSSSAIKSDGGMERKWLGIEMALGLVLSVFLLISPFSTV